ncbi:MAG: FtsB family cell division protein [Fidelibacterota bacterium]|jgi:cell division protein FtsB|tara:strand:- start:9871 stop:10224 length:354 start_codon:yes stop_codon:yes gene_type:complete
MINNSNSKRVKRKNSKQVYKTDIQKRIIRSILLVGALSLIIIFFFGDHGLYQLYTLKKERASIQNQINILRQEKVELENEKIKLETDYKYIEELAREKYRMAKKGEKVFKVIDKRKK